VTRSEAVITAREIREERGDGPITTRAEQLAEWILREFDHVVCECPRSEFDHDGDGGRYKGY
jgi:hypothetical protein